MLDYLIFAATSLLVLIISVIYLYPGSKKLTTVPGPEPVDPLEGNFPDITACGSLHKFLEKIHDVYGDITSFWAGPQLCISVASPSYFEQLTGYFDRPENLFSALQLLWGDSALFMTNGSTGRKQHGQLTKCLNPSFLNSSLKLKHKFIAKQVESYKSLPKGHFPLYENASLLVLEYLVTTLLRAGGAGGEERGGDGDGREVELSKEELLSLKTDLDHAGAEVDQFIVDVQDIDGKREQRLQKHKDAIQAFIRKELSRNKPSKKKDDSFDDVSKEAERLLSIICDGYFKLSSFLTWFGYYVAMEPDVQTRLRKEMCKLDLQNVKVEDFEKLTYLQACMKETLRLGRIVPCTARVQNFETVFGEHKIPAGTPILQALGVLSMNEDVFENAQSFNPDRFLGSSKPAPFACHPFGFAGGRKCPGAQLSNVFMSYFFAHLLASYQVQLASSEAVSEHYGFYVRPKEEVWLKLNSLTS